MLKALQKKISVLEIPETGVETAFGSVRLRSAEKSQPGTPAPPSRGGEGNLCWDAKGN